LALGELAVAAGLLLVAGGDLDRPGDRLAVGNLGRLQRHVHLVAAAQPRHGDLDVELAGAGDELLLGLRVAAEAQRRVLLLELGEALGDLVLVALRLGRDGERD